jgi:hypothetical protein
MAARTPHDRAPFGAHGGRTASRTRTRVALDGFHGCEYLRVADVRAVRAFTASQARRVTAMGACPGPLVHERRAIRTPDHRAFGLRRGGALQSPQLTRNVTVLSQQRMVVAPESVLDFTQPMSQASARTLPFNERQCRLKVLRLVQVQFFLSTRAERRTEKSHAEEPALLRHVPC